MTIIKDMKELGSAYSPKGRTLRKGVTRTYTTAPPTNLIKIVEKIGLEKVASETGYKAKSIAEMIALPDEPVRQVLDTYATLRLESIGSSKKRRFVIELVDGSDDAELISAFLARFGIRVVEI